MVKATVSVAPEKHNLKSLPGGYVELKRLTYGQKVQRQEMATESIMKSQGGNRKQRRSNKVDEDNMAMSMRMMHRAVALFDFKHCIVDHNLTDENDKKLNFQDQTTLDRLDPKIGDEISQLIDDMNNFEEDESQPGN